MPAPGTAHGLGPHVVGRRVVVRRLVPGETGPSGGPAMTDVLGTCLSWDSTTCVVAPASGPTVTIPLELIVAGKEVPPRPSARPRVSAREAEARALTLWVEPESQALGDWDLRTVREAPGLRLPRANACLAIGDPGRSLGEAVAEVRAFYAALDRPALARVETGSTVEEAFLEAGWQGLADEEPSSFHVADLESARRAAGPVGGAETSAQGTRLLTVLSVDGQEVGRVRGELNGGWLGVHGLQVDQTYRRRGHGRTLMSGVLAAGAAAGADTVWLEVADDNEPALALYAGLGFRVHHRCRYLSPPTTADTEAMSSGPTRQQPPTR